MPPKKSAKLDEKDPVEIKKEATAAKRKEAAAEKRKKAADMPKRARPATKKAREVEDEDSSSEDEKPKKREPEREREPVEKKVPEKMEQPSREKVEQVAGAWDELLRKHPDIAGLDRIAMKQKYMDWVQHQGIQAAPTYNMVWNFSNEHGLITTSKRPSGEGLSARGGLGVSLGDVRLTATRRVRVGRRSPIPSPPALEMMLTKDDVVKAFDKMLKDACAEGLPGELPLDSQVFAGRLRQYIKGFDPRLTPFQSFKDIVLYAHKQNLVEVVEKRDKVYISGLRWPYSVVANADRGSESPKGKRRNAERRDEKPRDARDDRRDEKAVRKEKVVRKPSRDGRVRATRSASDRDRRVRAQSPTRRRSLTPRRRRSVTPRPPPTRRDRKDAYPARSPEARQRVSKRVQDSPEPRQRVSKRVRDSPEPRQRVSKRAQDSPEPRQRVSKRVQNSPAAQPHRVKRVRESDVDVSKRARASRDEKYARVPTKRKKALVRDVSSSSSSS